jgi:heme/copper-type cytochrome/quinol oxidase subunit 2
VKIFKEDTIMKKLFCRAAVAAAATVMLASPGSAATVGTIAADLKDQLGDVSSLLTVLSFVVGVGITMGGLFKFRAHSQNPNDPSNKLSHAAMLIFVGAALVAIPELLGTGISTVFGDGADTTDATTGFQSLN